MAVSIFPTPTLSIPSALASSTFTVPSANTAYEAIYNFEVAVYTITCASGTGSATQPARRTNRVACVRGPDVPHAGGEKQRCTV